MLKEWKECEGEDGGGEDGGEGRRRMKRMMKYLKCEIS